jgi:hypothetical protein
MSQQELLIKVTQVLNELGIDYMITGSMASNMQGEPRLTHDIDIVTITIPENTIAELVKIFAPPQYYLDEFSIRDANKYRSMFNLLDVSSGDKVDFWLLTASDFDQSRFQRKYEQDFEGHKLQVSSPEDTILAKLNWAKMSGGSYKQFTDAIRIYELQFDSLDKEYLNKWANELEIQELWQRVQDEANLIA